MKERYLKSIKYSLTSGNHRFPHIAPKDLKLLRQGSVLTLFCIIYMYNIIKNIFINLYFSLNIEQIDKDEKEAIKSRFNEERIDNWSSDSS